MKKSKTKKFIAKLFSSLVLAVFVVGQPLALAQEESSGETLYEPIEKQIIQLTDEGSYDDWNISTLETYSLKFLIRGKEALTWALSIDDGGFHNPAIEESYIRVLTIVNSLFILGLLAIAVMWMFSIIIPRKYLKKVILIYSLAVIFVNFALPVNRLFIDGTNLLQRTLLISDEGSVKITDIVQTPPYEEAIGFQNDSDTVLLEGKQKETLKIKLDGPAADSTAIGNLSSSELDEGGQPVSKEILALDNRELSVIQDSTFSPYQEQTIFRSLLIGATAIAYFLIALIFVLRIVILWALLILSPILLVLAIFKSTRGWFLNWLSMYGRWLLIGPLTALGIAVMVNIWQLSGLPITVNEAYSPAVFSSEKISNIVFYLPGKDTANTLSNSQEMMEYIVFLLMLYLPIFLGFGLTRRKVLQDATSVVSQKLLHSSQVSQAQLIQQVLSSSKDEETREKEVGLVDSFKHMVNEKIGLLTETALPVNKLKSEPSKPTQPMPSASNFLPEQLKEMPMPKILELMGQKKDSKASHNAVIEKLATLERISDSKEKEKVEHAMAEIQQRAVEGDREALTILHEIQMVNEASSIRVEQKGQSARDGKDSGGGANINLNVNEKQREEDRKVRDASYDSKSAEKGAKGKQKKEKERKDDRQEKQEEQEDKQDMNENPNPDEHAN